MYLKAVEIQGFKSFPCHEYIEFHPGSTCIVGPNGSGKSNVTDAVRWVLGEQSAKSLRGNKMEDVIFNGTSTRKRLGSAEVSIHIDNTDRYFDLDFDTIVVTRRYYRSGESEYLINQQACRLKDITELFADTGLGKDGYSIIEQGRVDDILSDRSDDRRKVFDEAAGIVKYKMRKQEAERKLASTDADLERLDDIKQEMERNLKPLARQAQQALAYKQLASELRDLDIYLTIQDLADSENKAQKQIDFLHDLTEEFAQLNQNREKLYQARQELLSERKNFEQESADLQRRYQDTSKALARLAEEAALAGENKRQSRKRLEDIALEEANIASAAEGLEAKLSQRSDRKADLESKQVALEAKLAKAESKASSLEAQLTAKDQAEAQRKADILQQREQIFQVRSQIFALDKDLAIVAEKLAELEVEGRDLKQQQTKQGQLCADLQAELTTIQRSIDDQEATALSLQEEKDSFLQTRESLKTQLVQLEQVIKQKDYQLSTLKRLEENREGYHQAVKSLSREVDKNPDFGEGLLGPVAELIRVESDYETAVEMSLGLALHNLVTRDSQVASRLIHWLKKEKAGRETFLPLDKIEARGLSARDIQDIAHIPGYLGTLEDHISCSDDLYPLAAYLGGRILLAQDLASALKLADLTHKRFKIVSLEGDLVNPGGSMTGGQSARGLSGLISRSREIDELGQNLASLQAELEANQAQLASHLAEEETLLGRDQAVRESLQTLKEDRAQKQEQVKHADQQLAQLDEACLSLADKQRQAGNQEQASQQRRADLQTQIQSLEEELQALEQHAHPESEGEDPDRQTLMALREDITDYKVSLGSLAEALKGISELQLQLEEEQAQRQASSKALAQEKSQLEQSLQDLSRREDSRAMEEKKLKADLKKLESDQAQLRLDNDAAGQAEQDLFIRLESLNNRLSSLEGEKAKAQSQADRLAEKLNAEKNRIWEEYRFSYNQAKDLGNALQLEHADKRRLKQLRDQMRDLPPVNHSAPQDYENLKERYKLLKEQSDDIQQTRKKLLTVIEDLQAAMQDQFVAELEAINREFQTCFVALFSGGTATLELAEGDILGADIEIRAQPPGKRLQRLSLLSGGERALTAIALVFAIFRRRPAPFCFLDEVDSALDEANVIRFAEFVKDYAQHTQFIVVTHRRGTMEAAERLYGVTMKERGVSTILSLALDEGKDYTN